MKFDTLAAALPKLSVGTATAVGAMDLTPTVTTSLAEPIIKLVVGFLASTLSHILLSSVKKLLTKNPNVNGANLNPVNPQTPYNQGQNDYQ